MMSLIGVRCEDKDKVTRVGGGKGHERISFSQDFEHAHVTREVRARFLY